jgi:hypothetical protein
LLTCASVPHADDSILAGGGEATTIGAEGHGVNCTVVTCQAEYLSTEREVPNLNRPVFAS